MAEPSSFSPFRLPPGALPAEAARLAGVTAAGPFLAGLDDPLPATVAAGALAEVSAGRAATADEACRAADGSLSGSPGPLRACLVSPRHLARIEAAAAAALRAGFAGLCLDRPDAPLAQGVLQSGFCADCQRAFSRDLARAYGEQFMPLDYLALAREALAQASGALRFDALPFGRDFWRFRQEALERALTAYARVARDAARLAGRPFQVVASFEAVGPAQFAAARHLDAALFPVRAEQLATGVGPFRLFRAVLGQRPCAASLSGEVAPPTAHLLVCVAAACGVEVVGLAPGQGDGALGAVRRFARARTAEGPLTPVFECALLYSPTSDLWSGGGHREQLERAGEALAGLQIQAPVVLRATEVPPAVPLVLASATALSPAEAHEVKRRVEAGGSALVLGELGALDDGGRPAGPPFGPAKPAGTKVGKGTVVGLPLLPALRPGALVAPAGQEPLARAVGLVLGKVRRAASVVGRTPVLAVLQRAGDRLEVHLVALGHGPAQGATLFLGQHLAGSASRARFQSAAGADEKIVMNPSGYSISTVLPAFEGYAVLAVGG